LLSVIAFRKLDRMRERSRSLMEQNRALYNEVMPVAAPTYGTVAFPRVTGASVDQLCDLLRKEHETTVVPGHFFEMPDRVRISLVASPEDLREGLARVKAALSKLQGRLEP
jgi:aspartate/methionine/tyrosine aminotransferase